MLLKILLSFQRQELAALGGLAKLTCPVVACRDVEGERMAVEVAVALLVPPLLRATWAPLSQARRPLHHHHVHVAGTSYSRIINRFR